MWRALRDESEGFVRTEESRQIRIEQFTIVVKTVGMNEVNVFDVEEVGAQQEVKIFHVETTLNLKLHLQKLNWECGITFTL